MLAIGVNSAKIYAALAEGYVHVWEICVRTSLPVALVRACLISLERSQKAQYRNGYQTDIIKAEKPMKPIVNKKKYARGEIMQKTVILKALEEGGKTSSELHDITKITRTSLRSVLSLLVRRKQITAIERDGRRGKLYSLK